MVAVEFLEMVEKFKITNYVGMNDFSDRLSFQFTVVLYMVCVGLVSLKQYFFTETIACYIQGSPGGDEFNEYLQNYCWVHGTIPLASLDRTPMDDEWDVLDKTKRIGYYQWVPFVLALQCILFYLPQLIWQVICFNRTGVDLEQLVDTANLASHDTGDDREAKLQHIVMTLEDMLFQHRENEPTTRFASFRHQVYHYFTCCIMSKRLGTWLIYCYFIIKCLFFGNALGQIFLMQHFLGYNTSSFGLDNLRERLSGRDWRENAYFPRVAFCDTKGIRLLGTTRNRYIAQCALPMNMLHEKLYMFLWFWTLMVCLVTGLSLPLWFVRICFQRSRVNFIRSSLRKEVDTFSEELRERPRVFERFIHGFLRHDGVFVIWIIAINAGSLVASKIVTQLWVLYQEKYHDVDFRNYKRTPLSAISGKQKDSDGGSTNPPPYRSADRDYSNAEPEFV